MLTKINVYAQRRSAVEQVTGWWTATEAAQALGVKPATLYAYVSRGVLTRRRSGTGQSLFDPAEIDRLARRGRPRRRPGAGEVVIESRITALGEDRPFYRGRDALELAASASFESVAEWLWTGAAPSGEPWQASERALAAGRAVRPLLTEDLLTLEWFQILVPVLAATDPRRSNLEPEAVVEMGRALIAGLVGCLPGATAVGTIADRLTAALAGPVAGRDLADADLADTDLADTVRAALVLVADHELAASTLAVRVAASVRADPYSAVMAGLGTMSGPLHGGASLGVESMLAEIGEPGRAKEVIGLRLRRGERIPGLGHTVYKPTDGRGVALLDRVRAAAPSHPAVAIGDAVLDESRRRRLPEPNIDFGLALVTQVAGMPIGSGEAIFAVGRTAGWLAHALEEYGQRTRLRLRAVYIG
jgi:citrate synthase